MHAVLTHPTILAFVDESMPNDVCYWVRNCNPSFPSAVIRNKVNGLISSFGALLHNKVPKVSAVVNWQSNVSTFGLSCLAKKRHLRVTTLISYLKSFGIWSTEMFPDHENWQCVQLACYKQWWNHLYDIYTTLPKWPKPRPFIDCLLEETLRTFVQKILPLQLHCHASTTLWSY